ncbi:MarR family winged helix-turn-helix transcriptional regulator [Nitriliruptor alkaliphilus]|uniref:MarR family winged helix-turn-helix transcriptional regulator n=1 Tax=Nitriliruptor alkaliphilus TaxID=427918 RepID=UPI000698FC19|nr:MarR family transcriptional regulator [Nitriliruptor alkaliphilus]
MGDGHAPPEAARRWTDAAGAAESGVAAEVLELLMAVMSHLRSHLADEVARHELNAMQFFALRSLTEPTPMGQLAEQLHCDRSHVTGVADELERLGAVERQPHPDDRRVKLLVLTDVGEALRDRVEAGLLARLPVVEGLDEDQQRQLRDLLATVAAAGGSPGATTVSGEPATS